MLISILSIFLLTRETHWAIKTFVRVILVIDSYTGFDLKVLVEFYIVTELTGVIWDVADGQHLDSTSHRNVSWNVGAGRMCPFRFSIDIEWLAHGLCADTPFWVRGLYWIAVALLHLKLIIIISRYSYWNAKILDFKYCKFLLFCRLSCFMCKLFKSDRLLWCNHWNL